MGGIVRALSLAALTAVSAVGPSAAQDPPSAAQDKSRSPVRNEALPAVEVDEGCRGWLPAVVGTSPTRDRVIVGLWAMHPFEPQFPEIDATQGLGGVWGHWFGATFVNSYGERTVALGVERNWFHRGRGRAGLGVGYRVGLIAGYDERLVEIARHTPVLPFGGVVVWARYGPVAIDSYYVYRAITLETSLVF